MDKGITPPPVSKLTLRENEMILSLSSGYPSELGQRQAGLRYLFVDVTTIVYFGLYDQYVKMKHTFLIRILFLDIWYRNRFNEQRYLVLRLLI